MVSHKETYLYRLVAGCDVKADLYRADGKALHPALIWIHGGALIGGHRCNIANEQLGLYLNAGYSVVSIDYRLAPETKLAGIVSDLRQAFRWVARDGPERLGIDPGRIAVVGHSAGGYLTLMSGFAVKPRPRALVSFYGYGDITEAWYSKPDPFYCKQAPVTRQDAYRAVGSRAISTPPDSSPRHLFYLYLRQRGLWPKVVVGHDPLSEPEAFDRFCPVRNVTASYPPTLLLHGTKDTDVPYQQSLNMSLELARIGVEHELITVPGGGHGFDSPGLSDPVVAEVFRRVLGFLDRHLGPS